MFWYASRLPPSHKYTIESNILVFFDATSWTKSGFIVVPTRWIPLVKWCIRHWTCAHFIWGAACMLTNIGGTSPRRKISENFVKIFSNFLVQITPLNGRLQAYKLFNGCGNLYTYIRLVDNCEKLHEWGNMCIVRVPWFLARIPPFVVAISGGGID